MKLTTNAHNPSALKVLLAAQLANLKLDLEIVDLAPESRHRPRLPLLQVGEEVRLFCTNAAITYLMEMSNHTVTTEIDNLAHFESQCLTPLIISYLGEKGDSDLGLIRDLQSNLESIEKKLSKKFLSGQKPSFADAIIWPSIYILVRSNDSVVSKFPKIQEWADQLEKLAPFADAVRTLKPAVGKEAVKLILLCNCTASFSTFGERSACAAKVDLHSNSHIEEAESSDEVTSDEIDISKEAWLSPLIRSSKRGKRGGRILPIKDEKNYLITSALPYVNNVPHLGNIIGCVLSADVFARYCRMRGRNVLYISGTDEYGTATETKALEEKLTPRQICDKYHRLHSEIYQWFGISFDYFGRTTTKEQTEVGQNIFLKLLANGYLKEMSVQQLFCQPCQRFLSDRFVEGTCPSCGYEDARGDQCDKCGRLTNSIELKSPRCKVCSSKDVITKESDQVFLDLPKLEEKEGLVEWLDKASEGWTPNARHIAKSWMREGLKERCITRDLKWGTPVPMPKFKDKVFYVWFDAPIGYISMTACYTSQWEQWWLNPGSDIEYFQFMAKDNVPFHSILFPASQKGTKQPWTIVRHIIATEYLNYEDGKFSKSRGVGVFGNDAIETGIPSDIWRFYLVFLRPESQDSAFSWDDFMLKNNSELLNNLGNFVNRSLTFIDKFFESKIPEMNLLDEDFKAVAEINREITEYVSLLELCKLRDALRQVLAISKIGNQYFQHNKPWTLTKTEEDLPRCRTVCGLGAQIVFLLATLLEPFMPTVSKTILQQLNIDSPIFSLKLQPFLQAGHQIGKPSPIFQKLEQETINKLKAKYGGVQEKRTEKPPKGKPGKIKKPPPQAGDVGNTPSEVELASG